MLLARRRARSACRFRRLGLLERLEETTHATRTTRRAPVLCVCRTLHLGVRDVHPERGRSLATRRAALLVPSTNATNAAAFALVLPGRSTWPAFALEVVEAFLQGDPRAALLVVLVLILVHGPREALRRGLVEQLAVLDPQAGQIVLRLDPPRALSHVRAPRTLDRVGVVVGRGDVVHHGVVLGLLRGRPVVFIRGEAHGAAEPPSPLDLQTYFV